jgi:glycosyltransferase involved in cell wall biosynthesis
MAAYLRQQLRPWHDRVRFLPAIARDRLHEVLAESDICIFPSLWENFPNACLEAMAAGQAVIGSRAGGMAEMIEHGRSGLLVPPRAPVTLAAAVNTLLANPTRQVAIRRCARARILKLFSPREVAGRMEHSYRIAAANALQR